jgi:hypothetical protein
MIDQMHDLLISYHIPQVYENLRENKIKTIPRLVEYLLGKNPKPNVNPIVKSVLFNQLHTIVKQYPNYNYDGLLPLPSYVPTYNHFNPFVSAHNRYYSSLQRNNRDQSTPNHFQIGDKSTIKGIHNYPNICDDDLEDVELDDSNGDDEEARIA